MLPPPPIGLHHQRGPAADASNLILFPTDFPGPFHLLSQWYRVRFIRP
jgi:hypothetical protein